MKVGMRCAFLRVDLDSFNGTEIRESLDLIAIFETSYSLMGVSVRIVPHVCHIVSLATFNMFRKCMSDRSNFDMTCDII